MFRELLNYSSPEKLKGEHLESYNHAVELIEKYSLLTSSVLSIACGTCWLESLIAKRYEIKKFTGIDFSETRIRDYANKAMSRLNIREIELLEIDFYDYKTDKKFDLIILCQAFHHMDSPVMLLKRCSKMLREQGTVLILGERRYGFRHILVNTLKHFLKYLLNFKSYRKAHFIFPGYSTLFPPDLVKGDTHYHLSDYLVMFERGGFKLIEEINVAGEETKSFLIRRR